MPIRDLIDLHKPMPLRRIDAAWIWRVEIHPKVRLFLWKIAWDRLPTCTLLKDREMDIPPNCPIYGLEESTKHALLHCPKVDLIWRMVGSQS